MNSQIRELLLENDKDLEPLINTIKKCRDEEDSHHTIASSDKTDTIISVISEQIIENGCKGAIEIAKRI
jgi:demethoxyubiquinone hydroxylase (CLK1/Coq7/Cat5 family)